MSEHNYKLKENRAILVSCCINKQITQNNQNSRNSLEQREPAHQNPKKPVSTIIDKAFYSISYKVASR